MCDDGAGMQLEAVPSGMCAMTGRVYCSISSSFGLSKGAAWKVKQYTVLQLTGTSSAGQVWCAAW